jgi:hypothetical protein
MASIRARLQNCSLKVLYLNICRFIGYPNPFFMAFWSTSKIMVVWCIKESQNIRIANKSFEYVAKLGTTLTNQKEIHDEEIKSRLNSWNACYYSVQNLLFSLVMSRN